MGYTQYWELARPLTADDIEALAPDIRKIAEASGVKIAGWAGDGLPEYGEDTGYGPRIALNGAGDEAHESFVLRAGDTGFQFCKTRQDPYDVVVTASLLVLKDRLKEGVSVSSDGEIADWAAGYELASRALGRIIPTPDWTLDR